MWTPDSSTFGKPTSILPAKKTKVMDTIDPPVSAVLIDTSGPISCNIECQTDTNERFNIASQTAPQQIHHSKAQIQLHTRSTATQTDGTNVTDTAVQCNLSIHVQCANPESKVVDKEDDGELEDDDFEWLPGQEEDEDDPPSVTNEGDILRNDCNPAEERKFIVFESSLLQLLSLCTICFTPCTVAVKKVLGTFVVLSASCSKGHTRDWTSQPCHKGMPMGNLLSAAATLFSGSSPATMVHFFNHMRLQMISLRTYFMVQSAYLCPVVKAVWEEENKTLLEERKGKLMVLGGDGRCCSPGHTAKYGAYSLMDLETSKVIETQLVQSNQVKNSAAMELEGLKRCLNSLGGAGVKVGELVTDRHTQVKKYMRVHQSKVKHHFDVWHMAKGVKKKLDKIGKKKGLEVVGRWSASISNHMYWCAASSGGRGPLVLAKWMSLLNHICNTHKHTDKLFKKCQHGPLEDREWLLPGSRAIKNIEEIITKKVFLKDLQKLAPGEQTSSLESFHNVICFFAPKHGHFFFEAMECRLRIAALHFNENSNRKQAETRSGVPKYGITYGKANQGTPIVKEVKTPVTFGYVKRLMTAVERRRQIFPSYKKALSQKETVHVAPVASKYERQDKGTVIERHASRFNIKKT